MHFHSTGYSPSLHYKRKY